MLLFLKGIIIGLGKIMPGVSGAMFAINLNVYEKLINSITNFFDDYKNNSKFILVLCSGIILAIVFGSKLIMYLYGNYKFVTMCFFLGLLVGGTYIFAKHIKYNYRTLLFIFLFISICLFFKMNLDYQIYNYLNRNVLFFLGGYIEILASLIPGISATSLLMLLGIYENVLIMISNVCNIRYVINNFNYYFFYGLGMLLSFIINIYLINYLFKKYKNITYIFILCLSIFSIIILLINTLKLKCAFSNIVFGLFLFFLGFLLSRMKKIILINMN